MVASLDVGSLTSLPPEMGYDANQRLLRTLGAIMVVQLQRHPGPQRRRADPFGDRRLCPN
jgi:hypothetical protein